MRWDELFADLEAQLDAAESTGRRLEVADRSRLELARIELIDRLLAQLGAPITVGVDGVGVVSGALGDVAPHWLCLEEPGGASVLIRSAACLWLQPVGRSASSAGEHGVLRRLTLTAALRALASGRMPVRVMLRDGSTHVGTIDRAHGDHFDLAEHSAEDFRRRGAVRGVRTVPFTALAAVRSL